MLWRHAVFQRSGARGISAIIDSATDEVIQGIVNASWLCRMFLESRSDWVHESEDTEGFSNHFWGVFLRPPFDDNVGAVALTDPVRPCSFFLSLGSG